MTVPAGTTEIKKDADGNITDLAVSTAIDEVKNGFSLTSENKKLHSISISDKKNPKDHWITLSAKESATELGIRLRNGNNKIIITLTENEKPLNIIKVSDTEKDVILTTSTDGTCVINKVVQNISVDKDWKYSDKKTLGRKNQIILNDVNGSAPYLELEYVKEIWKLKIPKQEILNPKVLKRRNRKIRMKNYTGFSHMGRKTRNRS